VKWTEPAVDACVQGNGAGKIILPADACTISLIDSDEKLDQASGNSPKVIELTSMHGC
jgi:hypothetical protein